MSAPVLSTMRHAATVLHGLADQSTDPKQIDDLRQRATALIAGRAAVDELIKADRELDSAYAEFPGIGAEKAAIERAAERVGRAITRRQDALANLGGAT